MPVEVRLRFARGVVMLLGVVMLERGLKSCVVGDREYCGVCDWGVYCPGVLIGCGKLFGIICCMTFWLCGRLPILNMPIGSGKSVSACCQFMC